ncbi:M14 metallopeptidase family protein [Flavobacterium sp. MK4S-17]|uniref:M14 family metallopeptidase n=1 Tax=Flavobacterium sp. MK4S-17 TaxID=2543737 RepID=UPI0013572A1C|nr:M14 metallopeptidase family protein [Flavobacterium sp. MK4S-17]
MEIEELFAINKEQKLYGRYITNNHIEPCLEELKNYFDIKVLGESVSGKPIYRVKAGIGKVKIFMWSQMHGNESTTTKAIFDFFNVLKSNDARAAIYLKYFSFYIIPILNPDGAELYTRENANKIDLNRDSVNLTQPESILLRKAFDEFKPDFCYNMHDQRTIFGLEGDDGVKPATVSFLAPAYNAERDINANRQIAINLIAAMASCLEKYIPGQVGRFDDSFNINCIGDMFQYLSVPTVLIEAGHFANDYEREQTRKFVFFAILSGFDAIYENVLVVNKNTNYFNIPENKIIFYDMMYKNVKINYENKEIITNFASQYKEVLFDNSVIFQAFISEIGNLEDKAGHIEFECNAQNFSGIDNKSYPELDTKADFFIGPDRKFSNGTEVR